MLREDAEAFRTVIEDLCVAFNRPCTDQLVRVFWEDLKNLRLDEVKRTAHTARKGLKKFPAPRDLIPERPNLPPPKPRDDGPPMSSWAIAANKILFAVAYQGHRGFKSIAKWNGRDLVDGTLLERCLAAKRDYVQMAENAELGGEPWDTREFNAMCREGFEKILGAAG